jgi:hypothetical protein
MVKAFIVNKLNKLTKSVTALLLAVGLLTVVIAFYGFIMWFGYTFLVKSVLTFLPSINYWDSVLLSMFAVLLGKMINTSIIDTITDNIEVAIKDISIKELVSKRPEVTDAGIKPPVVVNKDNKLVK